jgi:hypothetical protein
VKLTKEPSIGAKNIIVALVRCLLAYEWFFGRMAFVGASLCRGVYFNTIDVLMIVMPAAVVPVLELKLVG